MVTVAPYVPTYASRSPYITVAEFKGTPTGVNVDQLNPRAGSTTNDDTLKVMIERASSMADKYCQQILAATLETQVGSWRVRSDNTVIVPVPFTPLIQVNQFLAGPNASQLTTLTDMSGAWLQRKTVQVPVTGVQADSRGFVKGALQYVAGFANTVTVGAVTAGAVSFTVDSALGIVPGLQLTIYDVGFTERVQVASVTGNVITVAAPLLYAHATGMSISALPPAVKQAVIFLTVALLKTRGSEAHVMASMNTAPSRKTQIQDGGFEEIDLAVELLEDHRRSV